MMATAISTESVSGHNYNTRRKVMGQWNVSDGIKEGEISYDIWNVGVVHCFKNYVGETWLVIMWVGVGVPWEENGVVFQCRKNKCMFVTLFDR